MLQVGVEHTLGLNRNPGMVSVWFSRTVKKLGNRVGNMEDVLHG